MASQYNIEVALKNCFSTIGEAPHWETSSQRLVLVDIFNGGVLRYDPSTQQHSEIHLDEAVGFVIPRNKGGYVVGLGRSLAVLDFDAATVEKIVEVEAGTNNRFNDAKCDALGRLWAGTMGPVSEDGKPSLGLGSLYSLSADHTLSSHLNQLGISNGMDWSVDNRVMYYIDSPTLKVVAFDFDLSNGAISNQRTIASFDDNSGAVPDGMCVDAEDKLWVAFYRGSCVRRIDPQTGKTLQTLTFPATNITSCCFGGKNLDELYVTSGRYRMPEAEFQKQPLAGSLFKVTGLGVRGKVGNNFDG
ncbi:unnamed protein product [Candidula unifasciata]|uniref:Regucalcin n=1 Tax=Candidula unifasciata TaxID=100452 RepID=A0A8S3YW42_9EUPU|nr:unnamed protein product [Candidula unifasciata]